MFRQLVYLAILTLVQPVYAHIEHLKEKNILIIHSYEPSYQWTKEFQQGIEKVTSQLPSRVKLSIEYLDTKRVHSSVYLNSFKSYFLAKYSNYQFDGVLLTDDAALALVRDWTPNPFSDLPIIAGGINDLTASLDSVSDKAEILYERDDLAGTLELLKSLRPNLSRLYYVTDNSHTAQLVRAAFLTAIKNNELESTPLTIIDGKSLPETADLLSTLSKDDAVILSHYNTEVSQGRIYSYQQIAHTLSEMSAAPIFVFWEFYIQQGIVGGVVNRSEHIGEQMALRLALYLSLNIDNINSVYLGPRAVIDYDASKYYKLNHKALPDDVLLLNEPSSYLKENIETIGYSLLAVCILLAVIANQSRVIRHKRELNLKSRKIVALQKKTMQVQKEMIHVLGEAIETRSGETGNHVRRVAKISSLLGKLAGLPQHEIEMLEVISPMHDVGKISIPEAILDKPGKLTPDEWEIMKTHAEAGYRLLNETKGEMFQMAAIVAYQHHEKWNGTGYPNGLSGEDIHIYARITAIADVFDALLSTRCYKSPWTTEEVRTFFATQAGTEFDPELTEIVLTNFSEFTAIRDCYPESGAVNLPIAV